MFDSGIDTRYSLINKNSMAGIYTVRCKKQNDQQCVNNSSEYFIFSTWFGTGKNPKILLVTSFYRTGNTAIDKLSNLANVM